MSSGHCRTCHPPEGVHIMNIGKMRPLLSRRSFKAGIAVAPLIAGLGVRGATGQVATPSAMSVEETRQILTDYAAALLGGGDFGQYFAEDITVKFMDVGQEISGWQMAVDGLIALHTVQFDAQPEIVTTVVGEGSAAIEALFVGTHTDEFAGIPATGVAVNVPYVVMSSLVEGLITELRLYGFISGLMQQLSGATATPAA